MATQVTGFGRATKSEAYRTCQVEGHWYFYPNDNDWLSGNGNNSFSAGYPTEAAALVAAERWEAENDQPKDAE